MTKPSKLSHVVLHTPDVQRLADWYMKALDARVSLSQPPMLIFLTYDDEHHRIGFQRSSGDSGAGPSRTIGMSHLAFTFASAGELLSKYGELKGDGYLPAFCIHHGPTLSAYYHDPDGNVVEFFADVFQDMADAAKFMETPLFKENPVGKAVDFEALAIRAAQGASEEELLSYPEEKVDPWALAEIMNAALEKHA